MRLVFLGEDSFSNEVLKSLISDGHCILGVLTPLYDNFIFKRLEQTCAQNKIPFYRERDINCKKCEDLIRDFSPELIVICHFQKLLKHHIICLPSRGCINLHPSLLPFYRGMAPQHWPIINGEIETGISIHYVNEEVDEGDIILQKKINIDKDIYIANFQMQMLNIYKSIVPEAIKLISDNKFSPIKQNHLHGSYYGKLKLKDCQINLVQGCLRAYNLIRAVSRPYFGAEFGGFKIWKVHFANIDLRDTLEDKFGEGIHFTLEFGNFIKFNDGILIIDSYNRK